MKKLICRIFGHKYYPIGASNRKCIRCGVWEKEDIDAKLQRIRKSVDTRREQLRIQMLELPTTGSKKRKTLREWIKEKWKAR